MLASPSSVWGLGREVRAASLVLRVRTRLDCPEDALRELTGHSNPNSGIIKIKKKDISCKRL